MLLTAHPHSDCSHSTWAVTCEGSLLLDRKTSKYLELFSPYYIRLLQTIWRLCESTCYPLAIYLRLMFEVYMWSYVWIMFLHQYRCLFVTQENHVQVLWTYLWTFVNNALFVNGCWHPSTFSDGWAMVQKRFNQFAHWSDPFQAQLFLKVLRKKQNLSGIASKRMPEYVFWYFLWLSEGFWRSSFFVPVQIASETACFWVGMSWKKYTWDDLYSGWFDSSPLQFVNLLEQYAYEKYGNLTKNNIFQKMFKKRKS